MINRVSKDELPARMQKRYSAGRDKQKPVNNC